MLLELQEQIRSTVQKIERLRQIGKTVEEEKSRRVRLTADFAKKAADFLVERNAGSATELRHSIESLNESRPEALRAALRQVAQAVRGVQSRVRASIQTESEQFQKTKGELDTLQSQIKNLEFNRVVPSPLLDELNRQLPRRGRENPARQLRELCEVTDEEWRPALELAFSRKFAVVVSAEDYPQALRIYKDFQHDSQHESLVDPERALARKPKVQGQSLAEKIESEHHVTRAVLDELFGGVICVTALVS